MSAPDDRAERRQRVDELLREIDAQRRQSTQTRRRLAELVR